MTLDVRLSLTGLADADRNLAPEAWAAGLRSGFEQAGQILEAEARSIIEPHRWSGRFGADISSRISGSGLELSEHVGVRGVPEAAPLSHGWYSSSGRSPSATALEPWVASKVSGSGMPPKALAFVIARAIGKRGYNKASTPRLRIWERALSRTRRQVADVIRIGFVHRGKRA